MNQATKDKIKALKLARKVIQSKEDSHYTFLCLELATVARWNPELEAAVAQLRVYANRVCRAKHGTTLNEWLLKNRPNYKSSVNKARIQWIDWMIGCYEGKW